MTFHRVKRGLPAFLWKEAIDPPIRWGEDAAALAQCLLFKSVTD